jgi:hypothetical protein
MIKCVPVTRAADEGARVTGTLVPRPVKEVAT